MEQALNRVFPRGIPAAMEQYLAPNTEPDFGSFRRQSGQSSLDISLPELRYDVMARYPGYQVELSDPAPTKPTSLGLANFQQAKPVKDANLPLSPSIEAWLTCQAQAIEGKDRLGKATKVPLGPKAYPKLPSLKAERFEPSNAPSLLRVGQLPPEWHRLVADQGRISPETISFNRTEFSELQSSVSKMLAILSDLGLVGCRGVQPRKRYANPFTSRRESSACWNLLSEVSARVLPFPGRTRDSGDFSIHSVQTEREGWLPLKTQPSCTFGHEKRIESEPTCRGISF